MVGIVGKGSAYGGPKSKEVISESDSDIEVVPKNFGPVTSGLSDREIAILSAVTPPPAPASVPAPAPVVSTILAPASAPPSAPLAMRHLLPKKPASSPFLGGLRPGGGPVRLPRMGSVTGKASVTGVLTNVGSAASAASQVLAVATPVIDVL